MLNTVFSNSKMVNYYSFHKVLAVCYCNRSIRPSAKNFLVPFSLPFSLPLYPVSRLKSTVAVQSSSNRGILSRILKKMGWLDLSRSKLKRNGYFLYESVADGINYTPFFQEFDMEDSFFSWFLITELHVWLLLVRVMAEGEEGRYVRNSIVEAMWADVSTRAKKLNALASTNLSEQMTELSEQFQAAIVGYDEGLLSEDHVLAGAIWRRFFRQECLNPEQVECLVKYIRKQVR